MHPVLVIACHPEKRAVPADPQGHFLIRTHLERKIDPHRFQTITPHHIDAQGVAGPVSVPGIVDMLIHIQIRIPGNVTSVSVQFVR